MKFEYPDYSHSIDLLSDSANSYISRLNGYLDNRNEQQVCTDILEYIDSGTKRIFFDLTGLEYLSSSGIDLFEEVLRKMKDSSHGVILFGIKDTVYDVLRMYGYQDRFRHFQNLKDAEDYAAELDFEPFNIRCLGCSKNLKVRGPGSLICESCGMKHSVTLKGEVEIEAAASDNEKFGSPDASVRIGIYGENELIEILKDGKTPHTHCISIGNPGQDIPLEISKSYVSVLRLEFYDVDSVEDLMPEQAKRIPEQADTARVIDFYKSTNKSATGYDIHCWQGVSRSTAVGLGLLKLMGYEEDASESILLSIRPKAAPHKRIVRYFDRELGSRLSVVAESIHRKKIADMREELEKYFKQQ